MPSDKVKQMTVEEWKELGFYYNINEDGVHPAKADPELKEYLKNKT